MVAELHDVEVFPATRQVEHRVPRRRRSWKRRIVYTLTALVLLAVVLVAGGVAYFVLQQHRSPSGKVYVETNHGKVELKIPTAVVAPPTPADPSLTAAGPAPPTALVISNIGVKAQVFMTANTEPKARVVAWLYGSAMPGTAGNTVLYGARSGSTAVFERLNTLRAGDEVTVVAGNVAYVYQVKTVEEVEARDTSVLLPTKDPTLTLITDAGDWDQTTSSYTKRLVVQGRYVGAHAWSGK